jgi:Ulp1 family protease
MNMFQLFAFELLKCILQICRICRGSILSGNQVYFSSSYFFQKLDDEGPEGVASWITKKKKLRLDITVFDKDDIVPLNW